jgi:hypothetical protein
MIKKPSETAPGKARLTEPKIGRGNPPQHTRFVKGRSGNPAGRPKGSRNLMSIMMEAARDQVTTTIAGKERKISKIQATVMQLASQAADGNQASMGRFLDWIDEFEARAAAAKPEEFPFSEADLAVIHEVYQRLQLCEPPEEGH